MQNTVFLIICDNAFVDGRGRLSIIQTFETINTTKLPAVHPRVTIVGKFEINNNQGQTENRLTQETAIVEKSTGNVVMKINDSFDLKPGARYSQIISQFIGAEFKNEGVYEARMTLSDGTKASREFNVKKISEANA